MKKEKNRLIENVWILCLVYSVILAFAVTYCYAIPSYENTPETRENALESHETIKPIISEAVETSVVTEAPVEIEDVAVYGFDEVEEDGDPIIIKKFYTDEDAIALAKMLWGEARGIKELKTRNGVVSPECQQAAAIWTVLNRYDAGFGDSIIEIVSAPDQYLGYHYSYPVEDELLWLSYDVLGRWNAEKNGETDVGRVLPSDYLWFRGDGKHNHFRNEYESRKTWSWGLEDPYKE